MLSRRTALALTLALPSGSGLEKLHSSELLHLPLCLLHLEVRLCYPRRDPVVLFEIDVRHLQPTLGNVVRVSSVEHVVQTFQHLIVSVLPSVERHLGKLPRRKVRFELWELNIVMWKNIERQNFTLFFLYI